MCVTPVDMIDRAIPPGRAPGVVFCSFGDMLRCLEPGETFWGPAARGADVRPVYSPLDAWPWPARNP